MSKFTQEKWEIAADGCIEIYSENGLMIKGIAEVAEFDTEEGKANARLIATAPEMYDELYECLQFFKEEAFHSDIAVSYKKSIEELLARIDGEEEDNA